jgi:hypothetical protein
MISAVLIKDKSQKFSISVSIHRTSVSTGKEIMEGTCYILVYIDIQCNAKLDAVCLLQACIAEYVTLGCPSAPLGHLGMMSVRTLGMPISLNKKESK